MTYMSACLKEESGEISLSLKGNGTGGEIAVSGNRALRIRGYIENTDLAGCQDCDTERCALGDNGSLTIIRDDGYNQPFIGACAIPGFGGVDEAFEEYYRISEQLPTRIKSGAILDEEKGLAFAGAVVLQPLPFASDETWDKVYDTDLDALLALVKTQGIEAAAKTFDCDETVWDCRTAVYRCNCSKHYLSRVLVSLGEESLREIIREDGAARIHCHYCNTDYEFTNEDADKIFKRKNNG
jgi:molecular chaperone Hsp33